MTTISCRLCGSVLSTTFVDLGVQPLANAFIEADAVDQPETFYPLHARVCDECLLVQLPSVQSPDAIFSEYAYFSSYSTTWLLHARAFAERATSKLSLDADSLVVELASNDGYLLQYFLEAGVPVLGVEPAENVAEVARGRGVRTLSTFFGAATAEKVLRHHGPADLIVANNVLAHVPDLHDFVGGIAALLADDGTVTIEFPHILHLIEDVQFDTIYHEHFSYFSLWTASRLLADHGLEVVAVDELSTHGGSLRLWIRRVGRVTPSDDVRALAAREAAAGLHEVDRYRGFSDLVQTAKRRLLEFLIAYRDDGAVVAGYGAPAKGNTLLNYCGIGPELLPFTVDISPHKQGRLLPGSRIPILAPEAFRDARPAVVLILPWNLKDEIVQQMAEIAAWGGRFAIPIPVTRIID